MKRILSTVLCLVMVFALFAAMPATASAAPIYLTLAHNMAEDHAINVALVAWAEAVDEATDGAIQIDVMPGGTLGSEADCVSQIQAGQLEMTKVSAGTLSNFNKAWNCVSVPYVFNDKDHLYNVMNGEIGQDLYNLTESDGFIGLAWLESGTRCFYTAKTPIRTPADLKGLKIRTMDSQMAIDMMNAFGGSTTVMGYGDIYTGMQQGVIDGAENNITAAISDMIMGVSDNRYVILLIMNMFLLVMGMFLDLTPAVLIFVPIFLPIARSIGMSDVHFGLMLITNLGIGSVTPPVGSCLFVGCGVAKVKIEGVTKYIVPIFVAMVVALFLVTYIPQISLSLPYWTKLITSMGWNS